jgi:hypothetical protein
MRRLLHMITSVLLMAGHALAGETANASQTGSTESVAGTI